MQALLQARMASRRLPGKILMEAAGKPLLLHNLERIAAARCIERVIVATSDRPEDDPVEALGARWGFAVFRGSQEDVLDRIVACARHFGLPALAKLTADNPLIDPEVIEAVVQLYESGQYDYVSNNHPPTWQDGQEVEVIRTQALEEAWREAQEPFQREHVTPYLWDQPERYRVANLARPDDSWYRRYRWTLDYPEDYELMRSVFEALPAGFRTQDVMDLLDRRPDLTALNAMHHGHTWYAEHPGALRTVGAAAAGKTDP